MSTVPDNFAVAEARVNEIEILSSEDVSIL